jgi:hypothetical protein
MSVRWRERLEGMTYAWSAGCPFNHRGLIRPLVTPAGGTVFMLRQRRRGLARTSDIFAVALATPTAPGWRVSPDSHVIPGTTSWAVTAARKS